MVVFDISAKEDTFCDFLFILLLGMFFWKGIYSIKKDFASSVSSHLSEGNKIILSELSSLKEYHFT